MIGHGYDHNFVLDRRDDGELAFAARVHEPRSGRVLEIFTTEPGIQFYSGSGVGGDRAGKGRCTSTRETPRLLSSHSTFPTRRIVRTFRRRFCPPVRSIDLEPCIPVLDVVQSSITATRN